MKEQARYLKGISMAFSLYPHLIYFIQRGLKKKKKKIIAKKFLKYNIYSLLRNFTFLRKYFSRI